MRQRPTQSDDLADTVSYADLADLVRREMAIPSRLLEHACGRVARALLGQFPTLRQVTVRITKLAPPVTGLQCEGCGVELTVLKNV